MEACSVCNYWTRKNKVDKVHNVYSGLCTCIDSEYYDSFTTDSDSCVCFEKNSVKPFLSIFKGKI